MLGREIPSASASSLTVTGPTRLIDASADITETDCSPSVCFLTRLTIRIIAIRRREATSVESIAKSLTILTSLPNAN